MQLRPLGHRIYVEPDPTPTETASGFIIPGAVNLPKMSGIVRDVGHGPERDARIRAAAITKCLSILEDAAFETAQLDAAVVGLARAEISRYRRQVEAFGHVVQVGDRVVFAAEAGHEIVLDEATDTSVIVLNEDDVLAVMEEEAVA